MLWFSYSLLFYVFGWISHGVHSEDEDCGQYVEIEQVLNTNNYPIWRTRYHPLNHCMSRYALDLDIKHTPNATFSEMYKCNSDNTSVIRYMYYGTLGCVGKGYSTEIPESIIGFKCGGNDCAMIRRVYLLNWYNEKLILVL